MLAINISFFSSRVQKIRLTPPLITPYSSPPSSLLLPFLLLTPFLLTLYYFPPYSLLLPSLLLTPYYFSPYFLLHKEKAPASLVKTGRQGLFLRVLRGIRAAEWPEKGGLRRGV